MAVVTFSILGLFGIAFFFGAASGIFDSLETVTQRNGSEIVLALENYYGRNNVYPEQLSALEPNYLKALPPALTTQGMGWLYLSTKKDFVLAYWYWPEKFGAWVCLYESHSPSWVCEYNNWGPFPQIPTPQPR